MRIPLCTSSASLALFAKLPENSGTVVTTWKKVVSFLLGMNMGWD